MIIYAFVVDYEAFARNVAICRLPKNIKGPVCQIWENLLAEMEDNIGHDYVLISVRAPESKHHCVFVA